MIKHTIIVSFITTIMTLFLFSVVKELHTPKKVCNSYYRMEIIDSSVVIYDDTNVVGIVKLEGQLDSLMTDYMN